MLLRKKDIMQLFHENGKSLSAEALELLSRKMYLVCKKAIENSNGHKRIMPGDVSIIKITNQL